MLAEALRLLRTRQGLTQTAASERQGAPDFRTLSHWETRRKQPSLRLLRSYLASLNLDFYDLQEAMDQVEGRAPRRVRDGMKHLRRRVETLERLLEEEAVRSEPESEEPQPTRCRKALKRLERRITDLEGLEHRVVDLERSGGL